jgi:hypothetical protein
MITSYSWYRLGSVISEGGIEYLQLGVVSRPQNVPSTLPRQQLCTPLSFHLLSVAGPCDDDEQTERLRASSKTYDE